MNTILKELLPVSKLSYLGLGLIFSYQIFKLCPECLQSITYTSIFFLGISASLTKKPVPFFSGVFLYCLLTGLLTAYLPKTNNFLQEKELEELSQDKIYHLTPEKEVRKNFWIFRIEIDNQYKNLIVSHSSKLGKSQSFLCASNAWVKMTPEQDNQFFDFLQKYSGYYIRLKKGKCKILPQDDFRFQIKQKWEQALERGGLKDVSKDIAMGLLLGDSSYLSKDLKQKAREGGILHIFAASGLHLGILTGFIYLGLKQIPFLTRAWLKILPVCFAFFYLWLLQFPVSLTRAFSFIFLWSLASLSYRKWKNVDLLIIASCIILIFDEDNFLSVSFLLSFGAVFGIFFGKPLLDQVLFLNRKNFFTDLISVSLAASFGTTPVLLYYFHAYSFGSLFLNLFIIPITSFALPLLYLALGLENLELSFISDFFWFYADLILRLLARISVDLAESVGFYREFQSIAFVLILFFLMVGFFSFLFAKLQKIKDNKPEPKKKWLFPILGLLNLSLFFVLGFTINRNPFFHKEQGIQENDEIQTYSNAFAIKKEKALYIGGDCLYLKGEERRWIGNQKPFEVHIQSESCLSLGLPFYEQRKIPIYTYFTSDLSKHFPFLQLVKDNFPQSFPINGSKYVLFFPKKDSLAFLQKETRNASGWIVLFLPKFSRDSVEDWNRLAPLLGISKNWKFISNRD